MICARSYQDIPDDPRDKWFEDYEEEEEEIEEEEKEIPMDKKRIKMTDKELAIAMWIYLKLYIEKAELSTEALTVTQLKVNFLKAHGKGQFYWYNACFLCQRYVSEIAHCNCPLSEGGKDCGVDSTWMDVTRYAENEEHRQKALVACDKILKIIEEEEDD